MYTKYRIVSNGLKFRVQYREPVDSLRLRRKGKQREDWTFVGFLHDNFMEWILEPIDFDTRDEAQDYIDNEHSKERQRIHLEFMERLVGDAPWQTCGR